MATLNYILTKFHLDFDDSTPMPIEIPNQGRDNLAQWLKELDFKTGVEVGVAEGIYSKTLVRANPQMKLYGVDPFKPYRGYRDYTRKDTFKRLYDEATRRLTKYPNYKFIEDFSLEAVKRFTDNSLDFVYIDANHAEPYISQDIREWTKKVRPGGIVAGHDYIQGVKVSNQESPHNIVMDIKNAIKNYTASHHIRPWFLIGLNARIPGMIRDPSRSWMFVKP